MKSKKPRLCSRFSGRSGRGHATWPVGMPACRRAACLNTGGLYSSALSYPWTVCIWRSSTNTQINEMQHETRYESRRGDPFMFQFRIRSSIVPKIFQAGELVTDSLPGESDKDNFLWRTHPSLISLNPRLLHRQRCRTWHVPLSGKNTNNNDNTTHTFCLR